MSNQNGKTAITVICTILTIALIGYRVVNRIARAHNRGNKSTEFVEKIQAKAYLRPLIDTINDGGPYADIFGQVDSFQYKDGNVIVHISLDEESEGRIWTIKNNEEKIKEAYLTLYSYPNLFQSTLLEVMSIADVGMTLDFRDKNSNDSCRLYIFKYGVTRAIKEKNVSAMDYILAENELLNLCPDNSTEDVCFEKVSIEGDYRVFQYLCKDHIISYMESNKNMKKKEILDSYMGGDGEDLVKTAGLGMKFKYYNPISGKECIITI